MNLASISLLYRNVTLAAGLRLTIRELIALKHIIPFDPLLTNPFGPSNTELFVDAALKLKSSKFPPALLRYLFLGEDAEPAMFELLPESMDQLLVRLREGLLSIASENIPGEDVHGERTRGAPGLASGARRRRSNHPNDRWIGSLYGRRSPVCRRPFAFPPCNTAPDQLQRARGACCESAAS